MTIDQPIFIYVSLSILILVLAGLCVMLSSRKSKLEQELMFSRQQLEQGQIQLQDNQTKLAEQHQELSTLRTEQLESQRVMGELLQKAEQIEALKAEKTDWQNQAQRAVAEKADLRTQLEAQSARFEQERQASKEKLALLEDAEKRLQEQFENLANKIFEKKHETFNQTSKAGLDALLTPLKEQIEGFKKQVSDQYVKEGQERASLKTEILGLKELNKQITEEAAALTRALKGDNKQQGNWGEVVLERILQESGLREGHEFETQVSLKNESGKTYQPDVVVHLPNDKDIVIDSKVSLAAYERCFNETEDDNARQTYLSEHVNSIKAHIKELGKKDYQDLQGIRTLDYVLMFIPIEAAFLLAVEESPDLIKLALDNNIMLVSPTNLLVALRTINNIWQYEYQNENAQNIAKKAADLYDKFVAFTQDMDGLGTSLQTVQKKYDGAMNKLTEGRGNLVRRAEEFRKLGVQANKKLDQKLLDKANLDELPAPEED